MSVVTPIPKNNQEKNEKEETALLMITDIQVNNVQDDQRKPDENTQKNPKPAQAIPHTTAVFTQKSPKPTALYFQHRIPLKSIGKNPEQIMTEQHKKDKEQFEEFFVIHKYKLDKLKIDTSKLTQELKNIHDLEKQAIYKDKDEPIYKCYGKILPTSLSPGLLIEYLELRTARAKMAVTLKQYLNNDPNSQILSIPSEAERGKLRKALIISFNNCTTLLEYLIKFGQKSTQGFTEPMFTRRLPVTLDRQYSEPCSILQDNLKVDYFTAQRNLPIDGFGKLLKELTTDSKGCGGCFPFSN